MDQRRQPESTHHIPRRAFDGEQLYIVDPLDPDDFVEAFREAGKTFRAQETIIEVRELVLRVAEIIDPTLNQHLSDVGVVTESLLEDKRFQQQLEAIILKRHRGKERVEEVRAIFEPAMRERIRLGMQLHDIGKLPLDLNKLTHKVGMPPKEEMERMEQHTGVAYILQLLGIEDHIVRAIACYHHAPNYFGTDPYYEDVQIFPIHVKVEDCPFSIPLYITLAKLIDIFHAFLEDRAYKKRGGFLWWDEATQCVPEKHHLKHRWTTEGEMKNKTPEDANLGGDIITLFLETMDRLWPSIEPNLTATLLPMSRRKQPTPEELDMLEAHLIAHHQ